MKYYIGIELGNEIVNLIGIGENEKEALKDKGDGIAKAFCIDDTFYITLREWLLDETDMVLTEVKDLIEELINKIIKG